MKRLIAAGVLFAVVSTGCVFGDGPRGAADELAERASLVKDATFAAVYRFNFVRQAAPGVSTRLEIVQQPPVTVRKVESTTKRADGKAVKLTSWLVHNAQGDFACNEFAGVGVRCQKNPVARTVFASAKIDPFFDLPKDPNAFSSVRKVATPVRVAGQQGTCFEAVPVSASPSSPAATSPQATADRFRFELCYTTDGILLRGRRTTLDEGGAADNAESFVEIANLSRVVEPAELKLPGAVVDPDDLG